MIASPAVAWGRYTESRPSPLPATKRAAWDVMSVTDGAEPVWRVISTLSTRTG